MPHVIVKLWPGPSEQEKARLADAIAKGKAESGKRKAERGSVGAGGLVNKWYVSCTIGICVRAHAKLAGTLTLVLS